MSGRPPITPGVAALLFLALAPGLAGAPAERAADLRWTVAEDYAGAVSIALPTEEKQPAGVEPIDDAAGVRYHRRDLGDLGVLLLAAHLKPPPAWLRVDRDGDGDLRDEEPVWFTGASTSLSAVVRLPLRLDGEPREVPLRFLHQTSGANTSLTLTVGLRREGEVVLAGRLRAVALFDANGDFAFTGATDGLLLDVDGDGALDQRQPSRDRIAPGTPFGLPDGGWTARVDGGGRVVFAPAAGPPPPPVVAWAKFGTPARGVSGGGEKTPVADLLREYQAAGERDAKQSATAFNERQQVLSRLGRVGTDEAFRALMDLFGRESEANLQAAILRATGYREYAAHAAPLFEIARGGGNANLVNAAVTALHGMDARGLPDLLLALVRGAPDDGVFSTAARFLGYEAAPEARALLSEKARSDASPARRRHAYEALTQYARDPPPADLVRLAAQAEDPFHRALGLEHAFLLALPEARDLALAALASKEERVLLEAVRILGAAANPDSAKALLGLADPPAAVAARAVALLRAVRDEATASSVVAALADRRPGSRVLSARVLGGLPPSVALPALAARVREEKDPAVLAALLRALGEFDSDAAAAAVLSAASAARKDPDALSAALDALTRLGFARPDARRFFESLAASGDPLERLLALEAAGRTGVPEAADLLLPALADREWRIRLVAAQALGRVRVKRAVPLLIDRLGDEDVPRVRDALAETLFRVTGRNFYDLPDLWRKWWAEEGASFEVPAAVPEKREDSHGGASAASFYGVPVNSDRIVFVLDQSGSMSAASEGRTNLDRAVEETIAVVEKLPKAAKINVILFETAVHPWQRTLVAAGASRTALASHLRSQKPTGGTNLYDALEMAVLTKDVDTIYLLSDGNPGSGKFVAHEDILREIDRLNRVRKIAIHCIAVGYDSPLLEALAARNDGRYVRR